MTNREHLIATLSLEGDFADLAEQEFMVTYSIQCPYYKIDERAHCHDKGYSYPNREHCAKCKLEWLEKEEEK